MWQPEVGPLQNTVTTTMPCVDRRLVHIRICPVTLPRQQPSHPTKFPCHVSCTVIRNVQSTAMSSCTDYMDCTINKFCLFGKTERTPYLHHIDYVWAHSSCVGIMRMRSTQWNHFQSILNTLVFSIFWSPGWLLSQYYSSYIESFSLELNIINNKSNT